MGFGLFFIFLLSHWMFVYMCKSVCTVSVCLSAYVNVFMKEKGELDYICICERIHSTPSTVWLKLISELVSETAPIPSLKK